MDDETWAPVHAPFNERYEVSTLGRVRQRQTGRFSRVRQAKFANGKPGYMKVWLILDGVKKFVSVHRLVAIAFVPGDHTLDVNHKDLDKTNNRLPNLEWVTHAENIRHGMANNFGWRERLGVAARKLQKPVISTASDGTETRYDSINHAGRALGHKNKSANVSHAINCGFVRYGCTWRYA